LVRTETHFHCWRLSAITPYNTHIADKVKVIFRDDLAVAIVKRLDAIADENLQLMGNEHFKIDVNA
jgi:hypothetical protein